MALSYSVQINQSVVRFSYFLIPFDRPCLRRPRSSGFAVRAGYFHGAYAMVLARANCYGLPLITVVSFRFCTIRGMPVLLFMDARAVPIGLDTNITPSKFSATIGKF